MKNVSTEIHNVISELRRNLDLELGLGQPRLDYLKIQGDGLVI